MANLFALSIFDYPLIYHVGNKVLHLFSDGRTETF